MNKIAERSDLHGTPQIVYTAFDDPTEHGRHYLDEIRSMTREGSFDTVSGAENRSPVVDSRRMVWSQVFRAPGVSVEYTAN